MELPVTLEYDGTLAYQANALADKWNTSRTAKNLSDLFDPSDLQNLDARQIGGHSLLGYVGLTQILHTSAVFLQALQALPALPETHIGFLGNVYGFANTPNARIRLYFYEVALHDPTSSSANVYAKQAAAWVVGKEIDGQTGGSGVKGGMGFCRPIFRALHLVDRDLAERTYLENKMAFHPIARNLIEKVSVDAGNLVDFALLIGGCSIGPWFVEGVRQK